MRKYLLPFSLLFLGIAYTSQAATYSTQNNTTIFQKMHDFEEMVLTTNLDSLVQNKRKGTYQPANLVLKGDNQEDLVMNISIRARGKFRRRTCSLPPIKLNFAKSDLKEMGLVKNYDKLKLVTHCEMEKNYEQHLLKEYWAYKMYNTITEESYRVKLFKITYIHEADPTRTIQNYAIVLENTQELAERLGGVVIPKSYGITPDKTTTTSFDQTIFFNYMIGNTDWALNVQRNLTLIQKDGEQKYTVIPYDFDQSKLVNAPYMATSPAIKEITEDNRHAMESVSSEEALQSLIALFKQQKSDLKSFRKCPNLKKKVKGEITSYLYTFFLDLGDKRGMRSEFLAAR